MPPDGKRREESRVAMFEVIAVLPGGTAARTMVPLQRRCHGAMSRNEEFDGSVAVAFRIMFRGATGEGRTYRFTMNRRPSFVTS